MKEYRCGRSVRALRAQPLKRVGQGMSLGSVKSAAPFSSGYFMSVLLCALLLTVTYPLFCPGFALAAPSSNAAFLRASGVTEVNFTDTGQYRYATFLLESGDYRGAALEFAHLIEHFPLSPLVGSAQLGMARSHFYSGRYGEAQTGATLFLKNFPDSPEKMSAVELLNSVELFLYSPNVKHTVRAAGQDRNFSEIERLKRQKYKPDSKKESTVLKRRSETPVTPVIAISTASTMKVVQIPLFFESDYGKIAKEMERLKASGLDTVIVRVFHNRGDRYYAVTDPQGGARPETGVYFETDHAPVIDDVLGPLVKLAHGSGLRIYAWMTTRYADYGLEGRDDLACRAYDLNRRKTVRCKGLDLFNDEAVKHLEALYSDMAGYAIDGVLFQDDLVLRQTEGFGKRADTLFEAEFGEPPAPEALYVSKGIGGGVDYTPLFWSWAQWKNTRLLDVADRLKSVVREKRPEARFVINLMYESVTNPEYALAWLSQDLVEAVDRGFDYYSIMAYHRQMESELNKRPIAVRGLISKMVKDAVRTVGDPSKVLVKLQIVDWESGDKIGTDEVLDVLKEASMSSGVSLAVVPYRGDFPYSELLTFKGVAGLD